MWHPDPPQGFSTSQEQVIIGRPMIPLYGAPQGIGGAPVEFAMAFEPENWMDANFLQRIPLTINGGQVPTTQNNFPLLINDTYTELIGQTIEQLRFAGIEDIQLEYEIEEFDNSTGELVAWVKKPTVSDGDIVYIYFDNLTAVDEQNSAAVWTENFSAVYHSNQTTFGSLSTLDSTVNQLHGTPQNMDITNQVPGPIDGSLDYNGTDERIILPDSPLLEPGSGPFTALCWMQSNVPTTQDDIFGKIVLTTGFPGWLFRISAVSSDQKITLYLGTVTQTRIQILGDTVFDTAKHLVGFTYDGSGDASGVKMYVDGEVDIKTIVIDTLIPPITSNGEFNIANSGNTTSVRPFGGNIDEVNIAQIERSEDWMKTVYNNQVDTSTFYSTGTAENIPALDTMAYEINWIDTDFLQRFPLTIKAGQVPTTVTDVPLLIDGTFTELIGQTIAQLRFAGTDNVLLDYEIQKFDDSTGELIAWAKKSSVSDGDIIYVYFDNLAAVDEQDAFAVWSDYKNVYHLNNVVAANSILDSTIAQETGDPDSTTLVAGKIGDAQQFDDSIPSDITFASYAIETSFSISFWFKTSTANGEVILSVINDPGVTGETGICLQVLSNGIVLFGYSSPPSFGPIDVESGTGFNDGVYHKAVCVYDDAGDNQELFVDGVSVDSVTNTDPPQDFSGNPLETFVGVLSPGIVGFDDIIDEFQTYVGVLSDDRILTEYNNQNDQSEFFTKGAVQVVPPNLIGMEYEE